jgi:hypothetical protein
LDEVECAIRVMWEGLEVEATCPPHMFAQTLGQVGNEMLRLNAALVAMDETHRVGATDDHHLLREDEAPG